MTEKTRIDLLTKGKSPRKNERETPPLSKQPKIKLPRPRSDAFAWCVLILLSVIIALFLFPDILIRQEIYHIGDIARRDIKASQDLLIENKDLTEKQREEAAREVLSVYDFDGSASNTVQKIREAFNMGRDHLAGPSPPGKPEAKQDPQGDTGSLETSPLIDELKTRFFSSLEIQPDDELFRLLLDSGFSRSIEETVINAVTRVFTRGVVGNRELLVQQMERGGIILHEISSKRETKVTDINRFYDPNEAKGAVATYVKQLLGTHDPLTLEISIRLVQALVKPNLTFNQRETEARKDQVRKSVKPIYFQIKKREMIVREGERIGPEHIVKLSAEMRSRNGLERIVSIPAMALLLAFLFLALYMLGFRENRTVSADKRGILFDSALLLGLFLFMWAYSLIAEEIARGVVSILSSKTILYAMPVACGSMLVAIFQGLRPAIAFSLAISVLSCILTGGNIEFFIYFFIPCLVASYGVRNCSQRGVLIKAGGAVGLANIVLGLSITMVYGSSHSVEPLLVSASAFAGGILSGVIATGLLPLIEMAFGFTTDIKLLELANLDQPLLRELMVRAPGSYHHSVIISNMVEATAKAVNANPLLAKVSAYYHDIGKMKKPLYFIENQKTAENKHEKLAPSMSSLILISHVKDGVELARKHKLGKEVIDIIQQHHGTSLISYFYHKAKDRMVAKGMKSTEINEEDFRYPGPKPQTKEAGLVMLADMVEASSRSLKDPTPARIQGMVQKIINKAFSDGQLDECELTLKDLHEIAKSFNTTLSGIFHQRVEYPESETGPRAPKRTRNGNTHQIQAENPWTEESGDKAEAGNSLKRLGLS
ncbi:MAG: HDIG domain-containing protein [Deltaproteobacteria bacterium]|nr:HDIG domain-containing protein [Deltaproteobacteria bacterium]